MADYVPNRYCACPRCRSRALVGPAVLITLGVLFLIGEFTRYAFSDTWPVLLIVIGLAKVLSSNAPTEGHRPPPAELPGLGAGTSGQDRKVPTAADAASGPQAGAGNTGEQHG